MNFGARLKMARTAAGLNQKELGEKVGVTGNAISNYENGTSAPNDRVLLLLFDALGVEPNFLFQDSFEKKAPAQVQELTSEEWEIIRAYRAASHDPAGRALLRDTAAYIGKAVPQVPRLTNEEEIAVAMKALEAYDHSRGQSQGETE